LHWAYARCVQIPDAELLEKWNKQRAQQMERLRARQAKADAAGE
jgi:hypothetical protein